MGWALSSHSIITREPMERVTLSAALAAGDLEPFIRQAEIEGLVADEADFDARLAALIKAPPQEGQTFR